jgi:F-type H+-transporting ATPase subunit delta
VIRGSLARRYARALMAIGQERDIYERLGRELQQMADLAAAEPQFRSIILVPIIGKDVREKILDAICKELEFHQVTINFMKLLNTKGRLAILEQIAVAFEELTDVVLGRVRADVKSATELSDESSKRIKEALESITGKEVIMEVGVDEELIGGIVTKVSGQLFDGSVKTQLESIEDSLRSTGSH